MEPITNNDKLSNKVKWWSGIILSVQCVLFLLFDSIMKIARSTASVDGASGLGFSDSVVQPLGFIILVFTVLYCIPCTAILGTILLTAHLGGAVAIFIQQFHGQLYFLFPLIFCILLWLGLILRNDKLKRLIPFQKQGL